ncbi:MAG: leucyl-tRNA synthetase, partial [Bacteroidia bacterium]
FEAVNGSDKPKYYVLDMFPYPSGAGLHVGHPLGYIASDIFSRYKRQKGFNVLHPMGYDSFGLPAEQYAIQTGQHPAKTTAANIATYRRQLDDIGFSYDWSREVRTSDPSYYKWTQWIFMQLFNSWYCKNLDAARPIDRLTEEFSKFGNVEVNAHCEETEPFSADDWNGWSETEQQTVLLNYRLTYLSETMVNWCPELGTVLANEEVKEGVSERGGYPVERKKMQQWSMRISAYAQRLLDGLNEIDWTDSLKEMQRNWIGRSEGASITFKVQRSNDHPAPTGHPSFPGGESGSVATPPLERGGGRRPEGSALELEVFTTRPDTVFGVTFMTLAPEHELVDELTTADQREAVTEYIAKSKKRSERDRMADVKTVSGVFTGAYAEHPFGGSRVPIWIGDYVLAGYGTGAVMAVPSGDQRDWNFAKHFDIPIVAVIEGSDIEESANEDKGGVLINSDFLNGMVVKDAIRTAIEHLERMGCGKGEINYRLRDAIFSRQRYWGEPIPAYFKDGVPYLVDEKDLPLQLPEVDKYLPTEDGEPPLARAEDWNYTPEGSSESYPLEASTMPGWAGSSWYYLRYMDSNNEGEFVSKEAGDYWGQIDLYAGGAEHATGHLLYFRFWTKFLFDLGHIGIEEPAKKLINQGMIQGRSSFVYRIDFATKAKNVQEYSSDDWSVPSEFIEKRKGLEKELPLIYVSHSIQNSFRSGRMTYVDFVEMIKQESSIVSEVLQKYESEIIPETISIFPIHVDVNSVSNDKLNVEEYNRNRPESKYKNAIFILEDENGNPIVDHPAPSGHPSFPGGESGAVETPPLKRGGGQRPEGSINGKYICGFETEKMSKSKFNVVNPDDLIDKYGADTLRMYEMFLGPITEAKPWNTNGIEGVSKFLKRFWRLFIVDEKFAPTDEAPNPKELKALHATLKKVSEDVEKFAFNTCVSQFMICLNELSDLKCNKRQILEPLTVALSSFAPHMCEEIWKNLGHEGGISGVSFPEFDESFLVEDSISYPISFNGKTRLNIEMGADLSKEQVEELVLAHADVIERLEGATPKKVIVVPKRIVNIVV